MERCPTNCWWVLRVGLDGGFFEDVDGAGGAEADDVGEADLGALDLAVARLAAQVRRDLVDVGDAGRADRVALRDQAAADVDGGLARRATGRARR